MTKYYISRRDYDKLSDGQQKTIHIFRDYYDNSQIQAYNSQEVKKVEMHKVEINGTTYELHYQNVEAESITHRKPHSTVKREWDDNAKHIKETISEQKGILETYVNEDLKGIRTNLFVDPGFTEVVVTKINELRKTLEALNLRVDKLKDRYDNVEDDSDRPVVREKTPVPNVR